MRSRHAPRNRAAVPLLAQRRWRHYFFTAEPAEAGAEAGAAAPSVFTDDFFTAFLWLFLVVVFAAGFDVVEAPCAGGTGEAGVCAAKVNGTAAAVRASARIVFFIVFFSQRAVFVSPAHKSIMRLPAELNDSLRRL
jgi:hypothetical protein